MKFVYAYKGMQSGGFDTFVSTVVIMHTKLHAQTHYTRCCLFVYIG